MKIKVGLYIQTKGCTQIDLSRPDLGNPGVGGTQFCFLLLCYYLSKFKRNLFEIVVFSNEQLTLYKNIHNIVVEDFKELIDKSLEIKIDLVIIKTPMDVATYNIIASQTQQKIITWSHNYFNANVARFIAHTSNIVLNVFVGKQMYDFYFDNDVIKKSTYIYNIVPDAVGECNRTPLPYSLTYMGCLNQVKGITTLMKIWSIIEKKYPNATLNILGGNLYDRNCDISQLGFTDIKTEKEVLPYVLDANGNIKQNIHFLGILGKEKYDVFLSSSVGIVNPSAKTETFGMGIIEMASAKLPVVTRNWNGHPDTAINGETALLGYSTKQMALNIIRLFEDKELNKRLGDNAKLQVKRFAPQNIIDRWSECIISSTQHSHIPKRYRISRPYWNNYKVIRCLNSFLRINLHMSFLPSILAYETFCHNVLKKLR